MIEETWLKVVKQSAKSINVNNQYLRLQSLDYLQSLISISSQQRKQRVIELLMNDFENIVEKKVYDYGIYSKKVLTIVSDNNLFATYSNLFQPLYYENAFNVLLIKNLIEINQLSKAELLCKKQIAGNFRADYNVPYLELLKEIYTKENKIVALVDIMKDLLPYTFNYDDYVFVYENFGDDEERKLWKNKFLGKAKSASHSYNKKPVLFFYYNALAYEENYKKMLDSITGETPVSIIIEYFKNLFVTSKDTLLKVITRIVGNSYYYDDEREKMEKIEYTALAKLVKNNYPEALVKETITQSSNLNIYRKPKIIPYLIEVME